MCCVDGHASEWCGRNVRNPDDGLGFRVHAHEPRATIDLDAEGVADVRWWTPAELAAAGERFAPPDLPERVRSLTS